MCTHTYTHIYTQSHMHIHTDTLTHKDTQSDAHIMHAHVHTHRLREVRAGATTQWESAYPACERRWIPAEESPAASAGT